MAQGERLRRSGARGTGFARGEGGGAQIGKRRLLKYYSGFAAGPSESLCSNQIKVEIEIWYIRNYAAISNDTTHTPSFRAVGAC